MKTLITALTLIVSTSACTQYNETSEPIEVDTNVVEFLDSSTLEGNFDDDSFGEDTTLFNTK